MARGISVKITPKAKSQGIVYSTFPSMTACAKELHIQESHISEVCSGKRKQHAGYTFEYANKDFEDNTFICCICGAKLKGWGNNPWPIKNGENDRCCDECNQKYVIPERIEYAKDWR